MIYSYKENQKKVIEEESASKDILLIKLGYLCLFKTIYSLLINEPDLKLVYLTSLDVKSGQLYKYYKKLGFNCSNLKSKGEVSASNFRCGDDPMTNYRCYKDECLEMTANISDVLESCCNYIIPALVFWNSVYNFATEGVAVVIDSDYKPRGSVTFKATKGCTEVLVNIDTPEILEDGLHGFHIHSYS